MYSIKKHLLNEMALISQGEFITRIIDIIKEKPDCAGVFGASSYQDIVNKLKESLSKENVQSNNLVEIDGLNLSEEQLILYTKLKKEFEQKEQNRLKTIRIKKQENLKITDKDTTPISFNSGIFFKAWDKKKVLLRKEKNICLEIIKVAETFNLSSIKEKSMQKEIEQVVIEQVRKHKNIDGTPVNIRNILPLYDMMTLYIKEKAEVDINHCIMSADLYMKEMYKYSDITTKEQIDVGEQDFSEVFKQTKFYEKYLEEYVFSQTIIPIYEDEKIKIDYPTGNVKLVEILKSYGAGDITWCTRNLSGWFDHTVNKEEFVAVLRVKDLNVGHVNSVISLKIKHDGSVDAKATCDYGNRHMDEKKLFNILNKKHLAAIKEKTLTELKNFELKTDFSTSDLINKVTKMSQSGVIPAIANILTTLVLQMSEENVQIFYLTINKILSNIDESRHKEMYKIFIKVVVDAYRADADFWGEWFRLLDVYELNSFFAKNTHELYDKKNNLLTKIQVDNVTMSKELLDQAYLEIMEKKNSHHGYFCSYFDLIGNFSHSPYGIDKLIPIAINLINKSNTVENFLSIVRSLFLYDEFKELDYEDLIVNNKKYFVELNKAILNSSNFLNYIANDQYFSSNYISFSIDDIYTKYTKYLCHLFHENKNELFSRLKYLSEEGEIDFSIERYNYRLIGSALSEEVYSIVEYIITLNEKVLETSLSQKIEKLNIGLNKQQFIEIKKNLFLSNSDKFLSEYLKISNEDFFLLIKSFVQRFNTHDSISKIKNKKSKDLEEKIDNLIFYYLDYINNIQQSNANIRFSIYLISCVYDKPTDINDNTLYKILDNITFSENRESKKSEAFRVIHTGIFSNTNNQSHEDVVKTSKFIFDLLMLKNESPETFVTQVWKSIFRCFEWTDFPSLSIIKNVKSFLVVFSKNKKLLNILSKKIKSYLDEYLVSVESETENSENDYEKIMNVILFLLREIKSLKPLLFKDQKLIKAFLIKFKEDNNIAEFVKTFIEMGYTTNSILISNELKPDIESVIIRACMQKNISKNEGVLIDAFLYKCFASKTPLQLNIIKHILLCDDDAFQDQRKDFIDEIREIAIRGYIKNTCKNNAKQIADFLREFEEFGLFYMMSHVEESKAHVLSQIENIKDESLKAEVNSLINAELVKQKKWQAFTGLNQRRPPARRKINLSRGSNNLDSENNDDSIGESIIRSYIKKIIEIS